MLSFLVSVAAFLMISYLALSLASLDRRFGGAFPTFARFFANMRAAWTRFLSEFRLPWPVAALLLVLGVWVAAVILRTGLPLLLLVGAIVVSFAVAWLREFRFLMHLSDDAFPGQNDKLIWAILMIVLPPVGVWLFHSYREAHWPETKPGRAETPGELG